MIALYVGYGLLILYTFMILIVSIALWGMSILGVMIYRNEDHTVDADWRPVAIGIVVISLAAQWMVLTSANKIIPVMWHSIPSISSVV